MMVNIFFNLDFINKYSSQLETEKRFASGENNDKSLVNDILTELRKEVYMIEEENWIFEGNYYRAG